MPEATGTAQIQDGVGRTKVAWDALVLHRKSLGAENLAIGPLDEFLLDANDPLKHPIKLDDREKILAQAELMLSNLYPHLPFKLDTFRLTNPVDWLKEKVEPFLGTLSELEFHGLVIAAFAQVRDAHTLYGLPSPFRGAVAFLPFQMGFYFKDGQRHYVVSKVMADFERQTFEPGVEILRWSGDPVDDVVRAISKRLSGGNMDAVFSRATFHMTLRPLTFCQPPSEDETLKPLIEYRGLDGQNYGIFLPWGVATGIDRGHSFPSDAFSMNSSHDCAEDWYQCMGCYGPEAGLPSAYSVAAPQPTRTPTPAEVELAKPSELPGTFAVQFTGGPKEGKEGVVDPAVLTTNPPSDARIGYIRIKRFSADASLGNTAGIVDEFRRLLTLMESAAPDGLIIDLRRNPGGDVIAAEQMLQMLTPVAIEPTLFHLANTPEVLKMLQEVQRLSDRNNRANFSGPQESHFFDARAALKPWLADAGNVPLPQGERLTSGHTLTDKDGANSIGQIYHGRTALLIDALTYSAAEIFAAGFQDHGIGQIIGMDHNTGGGGANVWTHADLVKLLGPTTKLKLETLPSDVTMSLAIRRNSRVGLFPGQFVEDIGVKPDVPPYAPDSVDDVLFDYPGLVQMACNMIAQSPQFRADPVNTTVNADGSVELELRSINIDAIDVFLDGSKDPILPKHPVTRLPDQGVSTQTIQVPAAANNKRPARMRIEAYTLASTAEVTQLELAAVYRIALPPPAPSRIARPVAGGTPATT